MPDRRPAYGTDAPDRRPAYGSDLPDRRPAYGTDAPRSAFGTDAPRYSRSYDAPSAFDSGRARQPSFNSPQRDVPSDLQSMWAGSPSDMLSPAECQDGSGILELHPDGYGFLRGASLTPSNRDIYVSMAQVRRFYLRTGDFVTGKVRPQRDGDKYSAMLYITEVNGCPADSLASRPAFDALTPCYPHEHITLEVEGGSNEFLDMRLIDLVAPIGFGQRGLIHCPPAVDKARLLSSIANAASICHPDAVVMTLLLGGRIREVRLGAAASVLCGGLRHGELAAVAFGGVGLPLALAMLLRPKYFPLWYVVQLVKGISVLAILLSLISLIGCKYGVIVENDDIMNAVRLWPEGRGVCLVLLCAGLLLSVGSICAARPVQRVGEYFGIAKK